MNPGHVHLIAIGGSVMHNLALALHNQGFTVSGSDDQIFEPARSRLYNYGICPENEGWFPEKINNKLSFVILGMHARKDNPELIRAQELNIPIFSFPEFIGKAYRQHFRVVIAGSHGKTTTTSMLMHVLKRTGQSFDYLVGALLDGFREMVSLGGAKYAVIEGDEYLSSCLDLRPKFLHYKPQIAVITGIAWDHYNVFPKYEDYIDAFRQFIRSMEPGATLIYYEGDQDLRNLVTESAAHLNKIPYAEAPSRISPERTFIISEWGCYGLEIFGRHNLQNLQAVREVCHLLAVDDRSVCEALTTFKGAAKRLELICERPNLKVFQDFAHAPSKVRATLQAVRETFPGKRILCYLELHTYSSLNPDFIGQYKGSLASCERAVIYYDLQAVQIKKMSVMEPEQLQKAFGRSDIKVFQDVQSLELDMQSSTGDFELILFLGSGNWGGLELRKIYNESIV